MRFGGFTKVKIENNELTKNNEIFDAGAKSTRAARGNYELISVGLRCGHSEKIIF